MRITVFLSTVFITLTSGWGQQAPILATTDDGRRILVYPDGTWKPAEQASPQGSPRIANPGGTGNTPEASNPPPGNSKVFVKAPQGAFGVWIDEQKWTENPANNSPIKINFVHQGQTSFVMIIGERVQVQMDAIERAALHLLFAMRVHTRG